MPAIVPLILVGGAIAGKVIESKANQHAADTQATAAEKATTAQSDAAEKALEFQKDRYNNTLKATADYTNMGAGALAMLGSGLGVTPRNVAPSALPLDRQNGVTTSGFLSPDDYTAFKNQVAAGTNAFDPNSSGARPANTFANVGNGAFAANSTQSLSQSGVRMQSPDGSETSVVSRDKVPYYLQQGAKVIQ